MKFRRSVIMAAATAMMFPGELDAQPPERRPLIIIPAIGVGHLQRNGRQAYGGLQLQAEMNPNTLGVIQASGWATLVACADAEAEPEVSRCAGSGVNADLGVNLRASATGLSRPFIGVGLGVMTAREAAPAVNARLGFDIGRARGNSLHVEARVQRAFGALDASAGILSVGMAFGR